jgi:NADPH2:quinone reductase
LPEGRIKPHVYQSFALEDGLRAHELIDSAVHIGKIVLSCAAHRTA